MANRRLGVVLVCTDARTRCHRRHGSERRLPRPAANQFKNLKPVKAPKDCSDVPGVTDTEIKVGTLLPTSGASAQSFAAGLDGIKARIEQGQQRRRARQAQDRARPTPTTRVTLRRNLTAAQDLVEQQGVFGIIENSPFGFSSAKYLNEQKVPVVGWHLGLKEFGTYTNMFGWRNSTTPDPANVYVTRTADVHEGARGDEGRARQHQHREQRDLHRPDRQRDQEVQERPEGRVQDDRRAPDAEGLHRRGAEDQGLRRRRRVHGHGHSAEHRPQRGAQAGRREAEGDHLPGWLRHPRARASPASRVRTSASSSSRSSSTRPSYQEYKAAMDKDGKFADGQIPYIGWLAADAFVEGVKAAGVSCPTREAFITNLRLEKDYDANGAFTPVDFTKIFGRPFYCTFYVQVENGAFVPQFDGEPFCTKAVIENGKLKKLTKAQQAEG